MAHTRLTLVLGGLLLAGVAHAADRSVTDRLEKMGTDIQEVQGRLDRLGREYGQRRGLIGAEDALQRYEDAVYAFLVGEHERAAMSFFTLVESEALGTQALHHDSQWYLAESVFEMGNWSTALEAYRQIVAVGPEHPFFADAVRRELEVYGILGDNDGFYEVYRTWILSGRVPATDAVKYTVARAFYRQGETARAKAMFGELTQDSEYYGRARYFLGTILAAEGEFPAAIAEFDRVVALEGKAEPEVIELGRLALGRLHYETGDYARAVEHYQTIPSDSPYFADQLYELVWTYIKQEDWENALRHVEIFLIAFPEHRYTLQMKLNQGHLHMKAQGFEEALASYETVVHDYTPLRERLGALEAGRDDPATFFDRMVQSEDAFDASSHSLPPYAVEMLVEDETMGRAVDASRELVRQQSDLDRVESAIDEISGVLTSADEAIGTFGRGRQELLRVRDDALQIRHRLLETEIAYLADNSSAADKSEVRALKDRLGVLLTRAQEVQGVESARTDRYQVHEDQVREVQEAGARLGRVVTDLQAEVEATRRVLAEKRSGMTAADVSFVEDELRRVETELQAARLDLDRVTSDATRRQVMASVPRGRADDTDGQRQLLASDYDELHRSLRRYRGDLTAEVEPLSRIDEMWLRVSEMDDRALKVRDDLERAEDQELAILRERLRDEISVVQGLARRVDAATGDTDALATDITRAGFGRLEAELYDTIMEADMGIVDVYWLRKTEVVDEKTRLATERGDRLQELDTRFNLIRQKLEE